MADEMAQGGQVSQTCNTANPNSPNTAAVIHLDKSLQVPYQGIGESVHSENQPVA